jgi:hypothetical protein
MKLSRLVGLVFAAVLAIGLMAVGTASAVALPLFTPATLNRFTGKSGLSILENSATKRIDCTSDSSEGEITGPHTVGSVVVTFSGCTSAEGSGCSVDSGGVAGQITTNTLSGELGLTLPVDETGLLLKPASGTTFVKILGTCVTGSPISINGNVIGLSTPNKTLSKTGKLVFAGSGGAQNIKEIDTLAGKIEAKLVAFSGLVTASQTTTEELTYAHAVEVM